MSVSTSNKVKLLELSPIGDESGHLSPIGDKNLNGVNSGSTSHAGIFRGMPGMNFSPKYIDLLRGSPT
jgi:hypothetical protein